MKKLTLSILTLSLLSTAYGQKLDRSIRPKPAPAQAIKLGKTESFTLPNGLKVFVVENHKLPTVSLTMELDIKPGLQGKMAGLHAAVGELLTSGTKKLTKEQFDEKVDYIGASIGASENEINASGLKKHFSTILELVADVAQNADFKQAELDKITTRLVSGLETQKNEPDAMLKNVSAVLNYGTEHPYGEAPTENTVKAITLDACKKYYNTYFKPNVSYLAIVGDVTMAEVKPLVEKYFGGWQKADVPKAQYPEVKAPAATTVSFVPREAAVQSVFNITYPVHLKIGHDDVIKAKVANTILGGGSSGRLFQNLRETHGWTYGSYSTIQADDIVGNFLGYAKCRNEVTDSSVTEMIKEINVLNTEKVDAATLQNTINYLSGNFAIGLESPKTVAQYAINIERYGMPKDYYQNYLKNLSAVTSDDILAVSRKYINTGNANIVVVGNKDEVADKLKKFSKNGEIRYYNYIGEEIKAGDNKAVPAGITADEVIKRSIAALGGEKTIKSIKSIKTVSEGEIQGMKLTITSVKQAPNQMKSTVGAMGMVLQKVVLNGNKGYQEVQGKREDLKADEIAEYQMETDFQADLTPQKYGITRTLKGMGDVEGKAAYILEVTDKSGDKYSEFYDAESYLLVKTIKKQSTPQGDMTVETTFSDYKEVPGIKGYKIPYTVKIPAGPGMNIVAKTTTVEVNKSYPAAEFE